MSTADYHLSNITMLTHRKADGNFFHCIVDTPKLLKLEPKLS